MTIRRLEELSDQLSSELAWRKKELSVIKSLIDTGSFSNSKKTALLRSGVTILYAHWEGFIKQAASNYLEFVSMQRLSYDKLSANFVALAMKSKLNQAKDTNKATIYNEVVEFFMTKLSERSSIQYKNVIQTSNLSSSVLREIVCMLGLDYSFYESKNILIDEKLLKMRNEIAHGNYISIDQKEYDELYFKVIEMMDTFRNQIDNCAATKKYCC
jgi:hypothetical protein